MRRSPRTSILASFPALAESQVLRYLTFAALYVAQGIPEGFIFYALPAWLAVQGRTPAEIGAFAGISLLPWSFKLVNAPLMDRFTYLAMGRRRPWVLVGQAGLIVAFASFAMISDPAANLGVLTAIGFLVSFFASFQDVAVDGMAIDVLPLDQQARANGIMWGAKTVGISASVALGSFLINTRGFATTVLLFAVGITLIMMFPLLLRERSGERLLPWTEGDVAPAAAASQLHDWKSIFVSLRKVFFLPVSLVMGVAVFSSSIGRGVIDTFFPIVTVQELGWADTDYSQAFAMANLASGLIGMFIGGALVDFFGKVRMMKIFLGSTLVLVLTMALTGSFWTSPGVVAGFILGFYVLFVCYTVSVFATAMQLCWKRVSATQFTLYMAVSNLGLAIGPVLYGQLATRVHSSRVILVYLVFAAFSLAMLRFVRLERHQPQIDLLEQARRRLEPTGGPAPAPVIPLEPAAVPDQAAP
jgi:PAT family beta-lactamase induction signal transducer AmpG